MQINDFLTGITANITNKTEKDSITQITIGNAFTDLAQIVGAIPIFSGNTQTGQLDLSNYVSKSDSIKFLTGITQTDVITALKFTPISGSTKLSGYSISSGDTLFDGRFLPIISGQTINNLQTGLTSVGALVTQQGSYIINLQTGLTTTNSVISTNYNLLTGTTKSINDINYTVSGISQNVTLLNISAQTFNSSILSLQSGLGNSYTLVSGNTNSIYSLQTGLTSLSNSLSTVAKSGNYNDLINKPTFSGGTGGSTTTDATQITSGVFSDLRLSSNVVLINSAQTLTNKTIIAPSGITKNDVGLNNVDNTSDLNKPISNLVQSALTNNYNLITGQTVSIYNLQTGQTNTYSLITGHTVSIYNIQSGLTNANLLNNNQTTLINNLQTGLTATNNNFNNYQLNGNYVSASTLNNYYTTGQTDSKYLPVSSGATINNLQTGLTATNNTVGTFNNSITSIQTGLTAANAKFSNYYTTGQTDSRIKTIGDTLYAPIGSTGNNTGTTNGNYQPVGNYVSASTLNNYYTTGQTDSKYLPVSSATIINNLLTGQTNNYSLITGNTTAITALQVGKEPLIAISSSNTTLYYREFNSQSDVDSLPKGVGESGVYGIALDDGINKIKLDSTAGGNTQIVDHVVGNIKNGDHLRLTFTGLKIVGKTTAGLYFSQSLIYSVNTQNVSQTVVIDFTSNFNDGSFYYLGIDSGAVLYFKSMKIEKVGTPLFLNGDKTFQTLNSDYITEGSKLFYTDSRVKAIGDTLYAPIGSTGNSTGTTNGNYQPVGDYVSATTLNNYYTKDQANTTFASLLSGITLDDVFDNQYHSAFGGDVLLTGYTVDLTNYYTRAQIDNKLSTGITSNNDSIVLRNISAPTTITNSDRIINITSGSFTQTLPNSLTSILNLKNSSNSSVTITAPVSIDGQSSIIMNSYDSLTIVYTNVSGVYIII